MPNRTTDPTAASPIAWPHMHFESIAELSLARAFTLQLEAVERALERVQHIEPSKSSLDRMQKTVDYYTKTSDRYSLQPEHIEAQMHRIEDAGRELCGAFAALQRAELEKNQKGKPGPTGTNVAALREAVASLESLWPTHLITAWLVTLHYLPQPQRQDWGGWFMEKMLQEVFRIIARAGTAVEERRGADRRGFPYDAVDVAVRVVRMTFNIACGLVLDPILGSTAPDILKAKALRARDAVREAQRELEEHRSKIVEATVIATRPKELAAFGDSIGTIDPTVRQELLRRPLAGESFEAERLPGI